MTRFLTVGMFLERSGASLQLEDLGEGRGLDRVISGADISSPGLALAGYIDRFVAERLQDREVLRHGGAARQRQGDGTRERSPLGCG